MADFEELCHRPLEIVDQLQVIVHCRIQLCNRQLRNWIKIQIMNQRSRILCIFKLVLHKIMHFFCNRLAKLKKML